MYILGSAGPTLDAWSFRPILTLLSRAVLWATTFLVSTTNLLGQQAFDGNVDIQSVSAPYLLGLGIADITGPVVETNMMGYADRDQTDTGLHMRQRSRAWIIADGGIPENRVVFINADIGMGDTGIRRSIVAALSAEFPGLYTNDNIALVATHSHAGAGGYLENLLPHITSLGYVKQSADAIVAGTVRAVKRAHDSLAPGMLSVGNTTVLDANINRSPSAYLANPAEERARYEYDQNKKMTLLRFDDTDGNARGFLSFFAVHGTSLYGNNTLISGDNKGMAAYLYESLVEPQAMPGNTTFVAGFTQSEVGDTSPNILGAYCQSPGKPWDGDPCDFVHSTCGNRTQDCRGYGPGFRVSDFESNRIIAQRQANGARTLMNQELSAVSGPVAWVHSYVNMSFRSFKLPNGTVVQTCPAALGYSFAGGTSDGPGAFDFKQGQNSSEKQNPFWELVKGAVTPPPPQEQADCHYPKPILLNTGYAHSPYEWSPNTVDVQILRVGNFVMLIMPGELTTMAGRRLREAVRAKLLSCGVLGHDAYVVVAGPANTYAHYVTTREEYAVQRYEGASTLYGPHTLEAYIDKYTSLVPYLSPHAMAPQPPSDPAPPDLTDKLISMQLPVRQDNPPLFKHFGDVLKDVDVDSPYRAGDAVSAQFVGANPRNDLRLDGTFLTVDQLDGDEWVSVRSDSHPSTTYQWLRTNVPLGTSTVTVTWIVEADTLPGQYRLAYYGDAKPLVGSIKSFVGYSSIFTIS